MRFSLPLSLKFIKLYTLPQSWNFISLQYIDNHWYVETRKNFLIRLQGHYCWYLKQGNVLLKGFSSQKLLLDFIKILVEQKNTTFCKKNIKLTAKKKIWCYIQRFYDLQTYSSKQTKKNSLLHKTNMSTSSRYTHLFRHATFSETLVDRIKLTLLKYMLRNIGRERPSWNKFVASTLFVLLFFFFFFVLRNDVY